MKNYTKYHTGLALLRILCAFSIVFCHFYNISTPPPLCNSIVNLIKGTIITGSLYLGETAVPVFMIMSFYLVDMKSIAISCNPFKNLFIRLWRLYFPVLFFSLLSYLIFTIFDFCFSTDYNFSFFDLILQLLFAHNFNPPMWYWIDSVFITILIFLVFYICSKTKLNSFYLLILLFVIAFFLQYSGINFLIFGKFDYKIKWTLGRFIEIVPYAVIGTVFREQNIYSKIYKYRRIIVCVALLFLLSKFSIPLYCNGFYYQGVNLLLKAICIFFIFLMFDLFRIDETIKNLICYVSRFSGGVICLHYLVNSMITNLIFHKDVFIQQYNFKWVIFIYLICLLLCIFLSTIPINFIKKSVI